MTSWRFDDDQPVGPALQRAAREEMKFRLMRDIRTDIEVCRLEGWDYRTYLQELRDPINTFLQGEGEKNGMKGIKVYVVHIAKYNPPKKVMNETVAETIKRLCGAIVPCKDERRYLGSLAFYTPELRDEFCRWCDGFGIYFTVEAGNTYIPAELVPEVWRN